MSTFTGARQWLLTQKRPVYTRELEKATQVPAHAHTCIDTSTQATDSQVPVHTHSPPANLQTQAILCRHMEATDHSSPHQPHIS